MSGFRYLAFRPSLARAALLAAGVAASGAAAAPARAQSPVTVNFNTLVDTAGAGIRYVDNCYTESGFTFTAVGVACGTQASFATGGPTSPPLWTGSPSLFLNDPVATQVDFTRADGGTFSINSIALAPYFGSGATVSFVGVLQGGISVDQAFTVAAGSQFANNPTQVFTFDGAFTNLTSVRMTAVDMYNEPIVMFDDVMFTTAATTVPEPTTVVLLAGGLFGVGMLARTRGARRRAASTLNA
ncbi:hypothetical protein tb265_05070 [Gemmatimonadetes bacterium T265]|nr:hypothetical protein tb265_05070 [Gemmatimonadetes bacterium T265]